MFGMPTYLAFTSKLVPRSDIPPKEEGATGSEQGLNRNEGAPYGVIMGPFLSPLGIPCQAPPWGTVAGVDLRTGKVAYQHRNGTVYDMTPLPLPFKVGVPGIGGPMITKGGVVFLGAAVDNYLRAYDLTTGDQLWVPGHGVASRGLLRQYGDFMRGIYEPCVKAVKDGVPMDQARALVLADPRVASRARTMQGFDGNIGKYVSLAYLEAEKEAF